MPGKRTQLKVAALVALAIAVSLAAGIGVALRRGGPLRSHPGVIGNRDAVGASAAFARFIERVDRGGLTLYEGLPHHGWEREAYAQEAAREDVVWHHGFPFYDAPVELDGEAAAAILVLLTDRARMDIPVGVAKACGGFHPDYSLLLGAGERRYECQLCFGCSDLAIMEEGAGADAGVVMSLEKPLARELRVLLDAYHQRRPITPDFHPYTAEEMAADQEADGAGSGK